MKNTKTNYTSFLVSSLSAIFLLGMPLVAQTKLLTKTFVIDEFSPLVIKPDFFTEPLEGGDTIFVSSKRKTAIYFEDIVGNPESPIVVTNFAGQVNINDTTSWGAISFKNSRYIKISGAGSPQYKYGFKLGAISCGLSFTELSSDCEAEFIKIDHDGFFGISAKKDYKGNPPIPVPIFENLKIHDCYITGVHEGMYLGEIYSPGMEFKHVRVYNNIVVETGYEGIQIANMVEDIEIYNNTLYKTGRANALYQDGGIQVGDNTSAKIYNNIFSHSSGQGIKIFGKGNIHISNNYLSNNYGIFIDNRAVTNLDSVIRFDGNYFNNITNNQVIKNYNEFNFFQLSHNIWEDSIPFFLNQSGNLSNDSLFQNQNTNVVDLTFENIDDNNFTVVQDMYSNIGATSGPETFDVIDPNQDQPKQIVLTPGMLVDSVLGGSLHSGLYLIDEQSKTSKNGLHPTSLSWKPHYNMDKAPYSIYFDLKRKFHISEIGLHDMHNIKNIEFEYGSPGNWNPLFTENCDKYTTWKTHKTNIETQYIRLTMKESVYASINELSVYGYPIIDQIVLADSMITDHQENGSIHSPLVLIDEQDKVALDNEHPTSESWKPSYTMANGPYFVTVDLGQQYQLFSILLHDMHNSAQLKIEMGSPGNWEEVLTENCDLYKTWKKHRVNITTQYLRLSMHESVYASINELQLFGLPAVNAPAILPKVSQEEILEEDKNIQLFPNPVQDVLKVEIPKEMQHQFGLQITDLLGQVYLNKTFTQTNSIVELSAKQLGLNQGVYILNCYDEDSNKQIKFVVQ
ncbi:MAG: right-handed parallel beta-helix repeat-containing protein [Flavobacteriales bacterium]